MYLQFTKLKFYKPIQNTYSLEFYIIGINYDPISDELKDKLYDMLKSWNNDSTNKQVLEISDYPESFTYQLYGVLNKFADNYWSEHASASILMFLYADIMNGKHLKPLTDEMTGHFQSHPGGRKDAEVWCYKPDGKEFIKRIKIMDVYTEDMDRENFIGSFTKLH